MPLLVDPSGRPIGSETVVVQAQAPRQRRARAPRAAAPLTVVEAPAAPARRGRGGGGKAAKKDVDTAVRMERVRSGQKAEKKQRKQQQSFDKYRKGAEAKMMAFAEAPIADSAIETGGVFAEAVAKVKLPKLHKYAGFVGFGAELLALSELRTMLKGGRARNDKRVMAVRAAGVFGRGVRMRATVGFADDVVGKIFGP